MSMDGEKWNMGGRKVITSGVMRPACAASCRRRGGGASIQMWHDRTTRVVDMQNMRTLKI